MIQNSKCFPVAFYLSISKKIYLLRTFISGIHITVPLGTACRDSVYMLLAFTQEEDDE